MIYKRKTTIAALKKLAGIYLSITIMVIREKGIEIREIEKVNCTKNSVSPGFNLTSCYCGICMNIIYSKVASELIGFNQSEKCGVCRSTVTKAEFDEGVYYNCAKCFWYKHPKAGSLIPCVNTPYWQSIIRAQTPKQLRDAFRNRANYILRELKKRT